MHKLLKKIYIIMFILPFFLCAFIPIRGQKKRSIVEARMLEKIPKFTMNEFIHGEFQDKIEKAVSDQMLFSGTLKKINSKLNNYTNEILINTLNIKKDCKIYINVAGKYYKYNCSNYLIEKPRQLSKFNESKQIFNSIKIPKYIYFIEKDRNIDFNDIDKKDEVFDLIKLNYNADGISRFEINSFEEYKNNFYQTDHHWNRVGQYKGYKDIINLLLGEEKTLEPIKEVEYDVIFHGSADRLAQISYSKEKFKVYEYPELHYKTFINGVERDYSHHDIYNNNKFSREKNYNHYAGYYGDDYSEVVYDFQQPDKQNLLVFCTSYSNGIKDLIASHFNKTYYVDLRHYKAFNLDDYIEKNNIDLVLLMGDITSFIEGEK